MNEHKQKVNNQQQQKATATSETCFVVLLLVGFGFASAINNQNHMMLIIPSEIV